MNSLRAGDVSAMRPTGAASAQPWSMATLSSENFERLRVVIERHLGLQMPASKRTMIESRLRSRLRVLGFDAFDDYVALVVADAPNTQEFERFADVVTTHKTDFFREPDHFDFLARVVVPTLAREREGERAVALSAWSAACATGEEPYTIAMVLAEAALLRPQLSFSILASDISRSVLEQAERAVYTEQQVEPVPLSLRRRYLLQSKDRDSGLVRVAPVLRAAVRFQKQNLLDDVYRVPHPLDIIFCRNVFIYFDADTQREILKRFWRLLAPGGYLFVGHTESLRHANVPFEAVGTTTYRKVETR